MPERTMCEIKCFYAPKFKVINRTLGIGNLEIEYDSFKKNPEKFCFGHFGSKIIVTRSIYL